MAPSKANDPTVIAAPLYFATMAAEHLVLRRRAALDGPTAGDYERRDTIASLTMGTVSLVAPLIAPKVLKPFTPGKGRFGKAVVVGALGAAAVTTAADVVARKKAWGRKRAEATARRIQAATGVAAVVLGGTALATYWQSKTSVDRLFAHRLRPEAKPGWKSLALAIAGWDFIYYWNHRMMHEVRYMWAIHVVHHSSEHYNLSTALRQPVMDAFGTPIPYGGAALLGITPEQVNLARGVNLLYQYWIHTETIRRLGPAEEVLNTASHHRVHHGSNLRYIDRNHGSILIIWDKLFATFEPEGEDALYGLTKNINTFNAVKIATHEFASILEDVAHSTNWRDRLSFVGRGPGWADRRRRELAADPAEPLSDAEPVPVS